MSVEQRNALRRQLRSKRRMLPRHVQQQASAALLRHCRRWSPFVHARAVAFYLPVLGEISPLPLMQRAHALGKQCYLPCIRPFPANTLESGAGGRVSVYTGNSGACRNPVAGRAGRWLNWI